MHFDEVAAIRLTEPIVLESDFTVMFKMYCKRKLKFKSDIIEEDKNE